MRILWICGSRIVGGAERVTVQLAQLLDARQHQVITLCRRDSKLAEALAHADLPLHRAPLGGSLNVRSLAAIHSALLQVVPDVALVTTADEWVWSCLAGRRPPRTRLVLVRHMAVPLAQRVCWLAGRRADAVVAVSEAVRDSLLGRPGIPPERIHVIYNPVRFAPRASVPEAEGRARARQALELDYTGRWVGFFGGLNPAKGLRDVLAAVSRANAAHGPTHLFVCGPGGARRATPSVGSIPDLAREFHLEGRLHSLGEIDDVEQALTAADVVVVATHRRLSEALPATVLEAMACGTPVLGYATGGIAEIIGTDGLIGRLARPDDVADLSRVLVEMLDDPAGARRMATAALQQVRERFDPEQAVDRYERLFTSLGTPPASAR